jgi:sarcosine oxidase, subunit gamma
MTAPAATTGRPVPTEFRGRSPRHRFGLKGPSAAQWLLAHGLSVPAAPNTWVGEEGLNDALPLNDALLLNDTLLVARLGSSEFFLEDREGGATLRNLDPGVTGTPANCPAGVYPVLRQDAAFLLSGEGSLDVLAQVCNVNFGELALESNPVIMTLMVGVAVLVIPQITNGGRQFKIWCDPTFGAYLADSVGTVVVESGGKQT